MKGFYLWPRVFRFATHYLVPHRRTGPQIRYTASIAQAALSEAGSAERDAGQVQSLPVLAIPIRVAESPKIQQDRARAQRFI